MTTRDGRERRGLRVELTANGDEIVDDIAFELAPGEIVGLVGESGSGKTTVAVALLGHAKRGTRIAGGSVRIGEHRRARDCGREALRSARGKLVSYVPQDPSSALNPSLRIGAQLDGGHDASTASGATSARASSTRSREVRLPATGDSCGAIRTSSPAASSSASASRSHSSCGPP